MPYKQKPMTFGVKTGSDKDHAKFLKKQNESKVKSTDYLTKTPVGPVAEKKTNDKGTLKLHLEERADTKGAPTETEMENAGDFNISNLHKDTKSSLDKKKKGPPCKDCGCGKGKK